MTKTLLIYIATGVPIAAMLQLIFVINMLHALCRQSQTLI